MKRLHVGNLSFHTTEDQLRGVFANYGQIESINLITDRNTGQSRGFAFVEVADDGAAQRAIDELNGQDVDGRKLTVNEARPREEQGGGRRDGGGRGGRGGYGGGRGRW